MGKQFEKHETLFCMLLIAAYIVVNSVCMQFFGNTSLVSFVVNTIFSGCLLGLMAVLKRTAYYGLTKIKDAKQHLYFIPLIAIVSVNLWNGISIQASPSKIAFHILTMINIGFIEEIIFRGFLFKMMASSNLKTAMAVSAITFGIGHIVNLLNGAPFVPTLMQICYATAIGYLFVVIFHKSKSLIPCIITHCLVNALSIFHVDNTLSMYIAPVFLTVVPLVYGIYLNRKIPEAQNTTPNQAA